MLLSYSKNLASEILYQDTVGLTNAPLPLQRQNSYENSKPKMLFSDGWHNLLLSNNPQTCDKTYWLTGHLITYFKFIIIAFNKHKILSGPRYFAIVKMFKPLSN